MISIVTCVLLLKLAAAEVHTPSTSNITASDQFHTYRDVSENVLCRHCGNDITFSSSIISRTSPISDYSFHDSIFNRDDVLIQVVTSNFLMVYPFITTSHSNCVGVSEWELADSWYPGYRWRACVCPECGALVGWVFEPVKPKALDQTQTFFGLIITRLVAETFVNSLTIVPSIESA